MARDRGGPMKLVLSLAFAVAAVAAPNDPVKLDSGMVSGTPGSTPGMQIYKGIPYVAPPVGDLRWRAPKPVAKWDGVKKADQFGPVCMQNLPGADSAGKISEDCLYLNV